jgi:hypothetical protein
MDFQGFQNYQKVIFTMQQRKKLPPVQSVRPWLSSYGFMDNGGHARKDMETPWNDH